MDSAVRLRLATHKRRKAAALTKQAAAHRDGKGKDRVKASRDRSKSRMS